MSSFAGPKSIKFYETCSKIGARARQRGDLDVNGDPIWSVPEWESFCRAYDACRDWLPDMLFFAARNTATEVRAWIASGMDAFDIHEALRDGGVEQEIHRLRQLASSDRRPVYYQVEHDQT